MKQNKNKPTSKAKSVVEAQVIKKLAEISEDIMGIEIDITKTIENNYKLFYAIMHKNGIKKYKKVENELSLNYEWTICEVLFKHRMDSEISWKHIFCKVPKSIMY